MTTTDPWTPSAAELRERFDRTPPGTIGIEEELMLIDAATGRLLEDVELHERIGDGDVRFKREMPVSQVEIVLPPASRAGDLVAGLRDARAALAGRLPDGVAALAAGAHPAGPAEGELGGGERYEEVAREFGGVARRQLICALQVHVAPGGGDRALAVHNALRSYLPEIAALAANAPFHEGRDTGMASIRPKIAEGLPRQTVPPSFASWEDLADALAWARAAGGTSLTTWWWEMRLHPQLGTIELRVPDTQTTAAEAAGVIGFIHSLVSWLGDRAEAGEKLPVHERWRIEQNRWSANRYGVEGALADLATGERRPTRERLAALIDELGETAAAIGAADEMEIARDLVERNGAIRQREAAAGGTAEQLATHLAGRFLR
jgi:carboxylate-amine ligase